jgi:hypothetical protein
MLMNQLLKKLLIKKNTNIAAKLYLYLWSNFGFFDNN